MNLLKIASVFLNKNKHIIPYVASGLLALLADNVVFLFFVYIVQAPLYFAVPAGLVTGLLCSFLLNKKWTFKTDTQQINSGQRQIVLYLLLFIFNNVFTYVFIEMLLGIGVSAAISKIIATACITLWNYIAYKRVIFR